jgi:hypothetical protein
MNKLLLLLSLIALDCAWNNYSILIAQIESEAKGAEASPSTQDASRNVQMLRRDPIFAFPYSIAMTPSLLSRKRHGAKGGETNIPFCSDTRLAD